ncbi:hypothetical protein [Streptomyces sp. NPDC057939]|uniref:hypothetical protein n=1 Tax=Streptomyces sp. NPDC057939 TaxID=3346284 RepID=UPI0036EF84EB
MVMDLLGSGKAAPRPQYWPDARRAADRGAVRAVGTAERQVPEHLERAHRMPDQGPEQQGSLHEESR